jgi:transcriptional regulator with XRE-family HTH domain
MKVRDVRFALRWRVSDLAKRAEVSDETIRRLERGESVFDVTLGRVVDAFNKSGRLKEVIGKDQVVIEDFEEAKKMRRT